MAKIDINAAPNVSSVQSPMNYTASDFGGGATTAQIAKFGAQLTDVLKERKDSNDAARITTELADARVKFTERALQLREELPEGAEGYTKAMSQEFAKYEADFLQNFSDVSLQNRNTLKTRMASLKSSIVSDAMVFEAGATAEKRRGDLVRSTEGLINFVRSKPSEYAAAKEDGLAIIEASMLGDAAKAEVQRVFEDQLAKAQFDGALDGADTEAKAQALYDSLEDPKSAWRDILDPQDFTSASRSALKNIQTQKVRAKQADALYEAEVVKQQGVEYAQLMLRAEEGTLTPDMVEGFQEGILESDPTSWAQVTSLLKAVNTRQDEIDKTLQRVTSAELQVAIEQADAEGDAEMLKALQGATKVMFENKELTESQYQSAMIRTMKPLEKAYQLQGEMMLVQTAMVNEGFSLDNSNTKHVDAVDSYYKTVMSSEDMQGMSGAELQIWERNLVQRTGVIPPTLLSRLKGSLGNANDPEQAFVAAQQIEGLMSLHPTIVAQSGLGDNKTIGLTKELARVNRMVGDPSLAYNMVMAGRQRQFDDPDGMARRERSFKDAIKGGDIDTGVDFLAGHASTDRGFFTTRPDIAERYGADLENLAMRQYQMQPDGAEDIKAAYEAAATMLSKVWGVTTTGKSGKRFMKHAPELVYGRGDGRDEWMGEQLRADLELKKKELKALGAPDDIADRVDLVVHPRVSGKNGKAMYLLQYVDDKGAVATLPWAWAPDFGTSKAKIVMTREIEAMQREAEARRENRARMLELGPNPTLRRKTRREQ